MFLRQENVNKRMMPNIDDNEEYDEEIVESSDYLKNVKPFKLDFKVSEKEIEGMQEAFEKFKDTDGCISLMELHRKIKDKKYETMAIGTKLFFGMIERMTKFQEVSCDPRINFDQFKSLVFKAMNMRKTKTHVRLLFDILDGNGTGRIYPHDLKRVSELIDQELTIN